MSSSAMAVPLEKSPAMMVFRVGTDWFPSLVQLDNFFKALLTCTQSMKYFLPYSSNLLDIHNSGILITIPDFSQIPSRTLRNCCVYCSWVNCLSARCCWEGILSTMIWLSPCPNNDAVVSHLWAANKIIMMVARVQPLCLSPSNQASGTITHLGPSIRSPDAS